MIASRERTAPQPQATAYLTADEITRLLENIELAAMQRGQYTLAAEFKQQTASSHIQSGFDGRLKEG